MPRSYRRDREARAHTRADISLVGSGYIPGWRGTSVTSAVWCEATSITPSAGADVPDGKLLAAKTAGALKLCPPSLSFTRAQPNQLVSP